MAVLKYQNFNLAWFNYSINDCLKSVFAAECNDEGKGSSPPFPAPHVLHDPFMKKLMDLLVKQSRKQMNQANAQAKNLSSFYNRLRKLYDDALSAQSQLPAFVGRLLFPGHDSEEQ